jgi:predicted CXXCH cytochrome family protein
MPNPFKVSWRKTHTKMFALSLAGLVIAGGLISCVTLNRVVIVPPQIPGAKFVGSDNCAQCHENITRDFKTAAHARLNTKGSNVPTLEIGCESCHGAGSVHSETGGARDTIINPQKNPETCFQCHLDMKGRFNLPHRHPIEEGKVGCSDCHNPHKGQAVKGGGMSLTSENETCRKCHVAQHGPFVFEHEAVREGCTVCHDPHGTVNAKMLLQRNQNLCLKCHFQQQNTAGQLFIGGRDHAQFVTRGTCWTAGCHEAVHGSQIGSSLRF